MYDAIIIGGGPAGLQAALTLGRMHRRTLLLDAGTYRNSTVRHAHNLLTNDGRDPAELRRIARAEIAAYDTVEIRDAAAAAVARDEGSLTVTVGDERLRTHAVILATGVTDELPPIPGLAEHWGDTVANCPFCHGHEFAGRPVAVINATAHAGMLARMLEPVASAVHVIDPAEVREVEGSDDGLVLHLTDRALEVAGAFVAPVWRSRSDLLDALGVERQESGAARTDPFGRTSVEGVYAVGDIAHPDHLPGPLFSLAAAIAGGQLAAVAVVQSLVMD
ncbi:MULTISPECIES: NAD(P)/FAD-dependent oxidoreductase [Microbacterium]|uniref:NAD(P)/FAD-dependent oxidoreductase n=1 Tax=Microbacterium algihabitans TaxID=3075992 RepID=A0ABU3RUE1_9MICO|nr:MULTISPECIES: NAD(P)/FAD-dependent oxidoreductase [Microbacterium]MCD2168203.1 NAD(P)/FAD-dependent oxidoreductase [Microbacterium sp. JC 701]MDU0326412.1 NAD(P)/FAD-dependent oxidoreductase [Microbacterium sp. KSW2-21]